MSRTHAVRPARAPRDRRRLYVRAAAAAALTAAALIAASQLAAHGSSSPASNRPLGGIAATAQLLRGIPQHGRALGSPRAPVTLVEYADLQCPYCGMWARDVFPALVREYVRTGRVRLVFGGLAFVGPDSTPALGTALAAAGQNRLWNVVDLLYRNQGQENSGWVTDALLADVVAAVPGLDARRVIAADVAGAIAADARAATAAGISSTPAFLIGRTGGALRPLKVTALEPAAFRPALDRLVAR